LLQVVTDAADDAGDEEESKTVESPKLLACSKFSLNKFRLFKVSFSLAFESILTVVACIWVDGVENDEDPFRTVPPT